MAKLCEVCAASEAKYKCPTCRLAYCSAACYKRHKEAPCAPASAAAAPPAPAPEAADGQAQAAAAPPAEETGAESEEDGPRLTADQLGLLQTSEFVRKHLENPAIVQALAQIDAAPDRMMELEKAMLDQTFASFICQALDEAAAAAPAATRV